MGQLTRRERMMLQEQLRHEQVCISKYRGYAGRASPAVRDMFDEFARDEEDHYRTLSTLLSGGTDAGGQGGYRFRGEITGRAEDEFAATSGERPIPVDAFGRQTGWQSTARQMLFQHEVSSGPGYPERDYKWGGLLPGDVPDTNHGDLTRGGLDRRGTPVSSPAGSHLDVHEGFPPPGGVTHVMPNHLERDGNNVASRFQRWRGPVPHGAPQHLWYGPTEESVKQAGAWSTRLVQPTGPVSVPSTKMEAAEEWDGSDLSPWSNLTSPAPLGGGVRVRTERRVDPANADDQTMLTDMLMTERFISSAYDTAVFDSAHPQVRRALQRIQRDEQRHGERISERLSQQPEES